MCVFKCFSILEVLQTNSDSDTGVSEDSRGEDCEEGWSLTEKAASDTYLQVNVVGGCCEVITSLLITSQILTFTYVPSDNTLNYFCFQITHVQFIYK